MYYKLLAHVSTVSHTSSVHYLKQKLPAYRFTNRQTETEMHELGMWSQASDNGYSPFYHFLWHFISITMSIVENKCQAKPPQNKPVMSRACDSDVHMYAQLCHPHYQNHDWTKKDILSFAWAVTAAERKSDWQKSQCIWKSNWQTDSLQLKESRADRRVSAFESLFVSLLNV